MTRHPAGQVRSGPVRLRAVYTLPDRRIRDAARSGQAGRKCARVVGAGRPRNFRRLFLTSSLYRMFISPLPERYNPIELAIINNKTAERKA